MKTSFLLKKTILITSCLYCLQSPSAFAFFEPATPVGTPINAFVTEFSGQAKTQLTEGIADVYKTALKAAMDLIYQFDPALPKIMAQNTAIEKAKQAAEESAHNKLNTAISLGLANTITKQNNALDLVKNTPAEDDINIPLKMPPTSIFGSSADTYAVNDDLIQAYKAGNEVLNIDTLLAPYQYSTDPKNNQDEKAQNYLNYLENLAPALPVIRISNAFSIPSTDPNDAMNPNATTTITLNGKIDLTHNGKTEKNTVQNLKAYLDSNPNFQNYKLAYRKITAAEMPFLSNLVNIYQRRVGYNGGKSVAQLEHDAAYLRLSPEYYQAITNASSEVLQRENLILLAELNRNIYEMLRYQERQMLMESISGLQSLSISGVLLNQTVKDISKDIACWADANCKGTTTTPAPPISPEITGIKP